VNLTFLLELSPCGQVQVTKLRCEDVRSLVWRRIALIHNGMRSLLWVYFFMYHVWSIFVTLRFAMKFWDLIIYVTLWWPWAKTIYDGFNYDFPLLSMNILWRIDYYLTCFKDECDTPFVKYSDLCVYLMKFLCREIGVLHQTF